MATTKKNTTKNTTKNDKAKYQFKPITVKNIPEKVISFFSKRGFTEKLGFTQDELLEEYLKVFNDENNVALNKLTSFEARALSSSSILYKRYAADLRMRANTSVLYMPSMLSTLDIIDVNKKKREREGFSNVPVLNKQTLTGLLYNVVNKSVIPAVVNVWGDDVERVGLEESDLDIALPVRFTLDKNSSYDDGYVSINLKKKAQKEITMVNDAGDSLEFPTELSDIFNYFPFLTVENEEIAELQKRFVRIKGFVLSVKTTQNEKGNYSFNLNVKEDTAGIDISEATSLDELDSVSGIEEGYTVVCSTKEKPDFGIDSDVTVFSTIFKPTDDESKVEDEEYDEQIDEQLADAGVEDIEDEVVEDKKDDEGNARFIAMVKYTEKGAYVTEVVDEGIKAEADTYEEFVEDDSNITTIGEEEVSGEDETEAGLEEVGAITEESDESFVEAEETIVENDEFVED